MSGIHFVFTGVVIREDCGFSALCPELDVASEGETLKEAKANLIEAVSLYLETAIDSNLPVVRPVPEEENPLRTRQADIAQRFRMKIDLSVHAHV